METLRCQPFEGPLLWNAVSSKLSRTHTLNGRKTGDQDDDMVVKVQSEYVRVNMGDQLVVPGKRRGCGLPENRYPKRRSLIG